MEFTMNRVKNLFRKKVVKKTVTKSYTKEERKDIKTQGEAADKLLNNTYFNDFIDMHFVEKSLEQSNMHPAPGETQENFESRVISVGDQRKGVFEFRNYLKSYVKRANEVEIYEDQLAKQKQEK